MTKTTMMMMERTTEMMETTTRMMERTTKMTTMTKRKEAVPTTGPKSAQSAPTAKNCSQKATRPTTTSPTRYGGKGKLLRFIELFSRQAAERYPSDSL